MDLFYGVLNDDLIAENGDKITSLKQGGFSSETSIR